MSAENQPQKMRGLLIALVAGVFALVAVGAAALLVNIAERKQEARHTFVRHVEVGEGSWIGALTLNDGSRITVPFRILPHTMRPSWTRASPAELSRAAAVPRKFRTAR